jgi:hypothetical protein
MATKTASRTATEQTYTYEQVQAIIAQLGFAPVAKPVRKVRAKATPKPAPKARPKASHGAKVTDAQVDLYRTLWKQRVTLRKELGLTGGFAGDEASTHKGMKALCAKMTALKTAGVNPFLVKW